MLGFTQGTNSTRGKWTHGGGEHRSLLLHTMASLAPQRVWRWDTTQGTTLVGTPGKCKALPHQGFTWARENSVCVFLFGITSLALQGEELCEHVSNSFMQSKMSIWKLFNRQNYALNSQQIKVISVNKTTKNSKSAKSVWSYIYSE